MIPSQGRVCKLPFPVGVLSIYFAHIIFTVEPPVPWDPMFWFSWRKKSGIRKALSKSQVLQDFSHKYVKYMPLYKLYHTNWRWTCWLNMMKHEPLCTYVWTGALTLLTRWSLTTPWKIWYTNMCVQLFTDRNNYIQNNMNYPSWNQQQTPLKTKGEVPKFDDPFLLGQAQQSLFQGG